MINNNEFQVIVDEYKQGKISENELYPYFEKLTKSICEHIKFKFDEKYKEDLEDMLIEKLDKYDNKKGLIFNFCTTLILCYIRQIKRKQK